MPPLRTQTSSKHNTPLKTFARRSMQAGALGLTLAALKGGGMPSRASAQAAPTTQYECAYDTTRFGPRHAPTGQQTTQQFVWKSLPLPADRARSQFNSFWAQCKRDVQRYVYADDKRQVGQQATPGAFAGTDERVKHVGQFTTYSISPDQTAESSRQPFTAGPFGEADAYLPTTASTIWSKYIPTQRTGKPALAVPVSSSLNTPWNIIKLKP
jgi:hypothetical protein